jgi:hypothetical protein
MFVRKEEGQRMLTMKLEVEEMDVPLFNLLSVIYELDLYPDWFPFCKKINII